MITPSLDNFITALGACESKGEMLDVIDAHRDEIEIIELTGCADFLQKRTFLFYKKINSEYPVSAFDALLVDEEENFYRFQGKKGHDAFVDLVDKVEHETHSSS